MAATDVSTLIIKVDSSNAVRGFAQAQTAARNYNEQLKVAAKTTLDFAQANNGLFVPLSKVAGVNREFNEGLRQTERAMRGASTGAKTATKDITDMFHALLNAREGTAGLIGGLIRLGTGTFLVQRGLQTVYNIAKQLIDPFLKNASAMEQMNMAYSVLTQSPEKGQALLSFTTKLATNLSITIESFDKANRTLLGFGFTVNEIQSIMPRLADVTQGNSEAFAHLALVYGQVRAQGKAMQQDIYQFVNAGIPIMEELGKVLGQPTSAIRDLIKEGAIGLPQFEQAIRNLTDSGGAFYQFSERAADTFAGQMTRAISTIKLALGELGEALLPAGKWIAETFRNDAEIVMTFAQVAQARKAGATDEQRLQALSSVIARQSSPNIAFGELAQQMQQEKELRAMPAQGGGTIGDLYAARNRPADGTLRRDTRMLGAGSDEEWRQRAFAQLETDFASILSKANEPGAKLFGYNANQAAIEAGNSAITMLTSLAEAQLSDKAGPFLSSGPTANNIKQAVADFIAKLNFVPPSVAARSPARSESRLARQMMMDTTAYGSLDLSSYGTGGKTRAQLAAQMMMDTTAYGAGRTAEYNPMASPYSSLYWPAPTGEEAYTMPYTVAGQIPRGINRAMGTELATSGGGLIDPAAIQALRELLNPEKSNAVKEMEQAFKNIGASMGNLAKAEYVDFFRTIGEAWATGADAGEAMVDSLAKFGVEILNTMAPLLLEAGLKAMIANKWLLGTALVAASGLVALGAGAAEGAMSMDTPGVKYNYGSYAQASNPYTGELLGSGSRNLTLNMQIVDQSSRGTTVTTETTTDAIGHKQVRVLIRDALRSEIASGSMDTALRSRGLATSGAKARS